MEQISVSFSSILQLKAIVLKNECKIHFRGESYKMKSSLELKKETPRLRGVGPKMLS